MTERADTGNATGATNTPTQREPRRRRRLRARTWLVVLGPGLIAANAGNDAGGIATYASAGSQFVYRTLFVMLLVTVALVVVQEMSARLGVYTGEGLVSLIREQFNVRLGLFAVVCLMTANLGLVISEFAGIGAAFELLNISRYLSVPIAAVVIWGLVIFGSYRYVERVFLLLTLPFLAYPIAAILGRPKWTEVASNTAVPNMLGDRSFLVMVVALIGTTITPYMQLYQAAAVVDRGTGADDYRSARKDAITGALFSNFISMAIIIATAAAIGGTGPLGSAKDAALALEPMLGGGATALFAIGLLGASCLAAAVVPLSTSYAISEAVGVERSVSRRFREAPLFLGLFTGQVVIGALVALLPGNLIDLLINTQIINGLIAPVFLTFILVLANRRSVLGDAANRPWYRVLATICVAAVGAMALVVVVITVIDWF
jgi:Mn2+/Fe2+ NRAMP family transporter